MERYRHLKRGSTYRLIGRATVQPGRTFVEGELLRIGRRLRGDLEAIAAEAAYPADWAAIGLAVLQAGAGVFPGDVLAYYRGEADGKFWARPWAEFADGRFEYLGLVPPFRADRAAGDFAELVARVAFLEAQVDALHKANNLSLQAARDARAEAARQREIVERISRALPAAAA